MSYTLCPHGLGIWGIRISPPEVEPSSEYYNILARVGYHHKKEPAQQGILNTITVLLLFGTCVPPIDDRGRSLDDWRYFTMAENIGHAIRLSAARITGESDWYARLDAMSSPGVDGSDVLYVFEYLKNNPALYGNPFYQWQQVHSIWKSGEQQCPNCWAEKMKIEAKLFHWLGDMTKEPEDSETE